MTSTPTSSIARGALPPSRPSLCPRRGTDQALHDTQLPSPLVRHRRRHPAAHGGGFCVRVVSGVDVRRSARLILDHLRHDIDAITSRRTWRTQPGSLPLPCRGELLAVVYRPRCGGARARSRARRRFASSRRHSHQVSRSNAQVLSQLYSCHMPQIISPLLRLGLAALCRYTRFGVRPVTTLAIHCRYVIPFSHRFVSLLIHSNIVQRRHLLGARRVPCP